VSTSNHSLITLNRIIGLGTLLYRPVECAVVRDTISQNPISLTVVREANATADACTPYLPMHLPSSFAYVRTAGRRRSLASSLSPALIALPCGGGVRPRDGGWELLVLRDRPDRDRFVRPSTFGDRALRLTVGVACERPGTSSVKGLATSVHAAAISCGPESRIRHACGSMMPSRKSGVG
jgi:hypothetical protein